MLKRDITYEDFNGDTVTDTLYFNLTSTELIQLETSYDGGLQKAIETIIKTENIREIIAQFQKILLMAYGERTADGKHFRKSDEIKAEFAQSAAYDALFMELAEDAQKAAQFIIAIVPKQLQEEAQKAAVDVNLPPGAPTTPSD